MIGIDYKIGQGRFFFNNSFIHVHPLHLTFLFFFFFLKKSLRKEKKLNYIYINNNNNYKIVDDLIFNQVISIIVYRISPSFYLAGKKVISIIIFQASHWNKKAHLCIIKKLAK